MPDPKTWLPHREDRLVNTTRNHIKPGGRFTPITIRQVLGGRRWSLALITVHETEEAPRG